MQMVDVRDRWHEYSATRESALREQLILQYAPLVKYVVGRTSVGLPGGVSSEDLISYGTIGLIQAVDRFDPSVGVKFETYAIRRIRGSILDAIRTLQPLSRDEYRQSREIERAYDALIQRLGRTPEDEEVAGELGWDLATFKTAVSGSTITISSLDTNPNDSDDANPEFSPIVSQLRAPDRGDVSDIVARREMLSTLAGALDDLPDRDRLIITLYYYEELTLKEIGAVLSVSTSRVSQLHAVAVLKLRGLLRSAVAMAA